MRLGRYAEAAAAYAVALKDDAYGKKGALLTNQGKALVAAGDLASAVSPSPLPPRMPLRHPV